MPLPKASRGASKKVKQQVMSQCMSETKGTGKPFRQRVAMCMESSGQSRRKRRGKK